MSIYGKPNMITNKGNSVKLVDGASRPFPATCPECSPSERLMTHVETDESGANIPVVECPSCGYVKTTTQNAI